MCNQKHMKIFNNRDYKDQVFNRAADEEKGHFSFFISKFLLITCMLLQCGSCWAFSVVGAVQSAHAIAGSPLQQLSVQQVVDCSYKNEGCGGGSPTRALSWLKQVCTTCLSNSPHLWTKTNLLFWWWLQYNYLNLIKNIITVRHKRRCFLNKSKYELATKIKIN